MKSFLNSKNLSIAAAAALLVLGMSGTSAFASTSAVHSATATPTGAVTTHGFTVTTRPSVTPDTTVKSVWAGYGQVEKGTHAKIQGGVDGWIVPKTSCVKTSPNLQVSFLLAWYDYTASDSAVAGIELYCAVGQTGPATILLFDPVNSYSGVSAGDQVTVNIGDYSGSGLGTGCTSTCTNFYMIDWTTGAVVDDSVAETSIAHTSFAGIVDDGLSSSCTGSGTDCPQVNYHTIKDGSAYATSIGDCIGVTNSVVPCVGYGLPYTNTGFHPIGATVAGATNVKFVMNNGDKGVIGAPYYAATGALLSDLASHTIKFKQA